MNEGILNCEKNPIVVVIPGLTSDSAAAVSADLLYLFIYFFLVSQCINYKPTTLILLLPSELR